MSFETAARGVNAQLTRLPTASRTGEVCPEYEPVRTNERSHGGKSGLVRAQRSVVIERLEIVQDVIRSQPASHVIR